MFWKRLMFWKKKQTETGAEPAETKAETPKPKAKKRAAKSTSAET